MKIVLLHGLGQSARDWKAVTDQLPDFDGECPELFALAESECTYENVFKHFEKSQADSQEPLLLCGLSSGAILALDYALRHPEKVDALILIAGQYKVPTFLIDLQNLVFRCLPARFFDNMGLSKKGTISLARSMRSLDFSARLAEIRCPATVVCGARDRANLKAAREMQALLPHSRLEIISEGGHELNKETPEVIARLIQQGVIRLEKTSRKS